MMYWFIHILILGFLSYAAFKQFKSPFEPLIFWTALVLKMSAGIAVGLIFHFYYGSGDSLVLFEQATKLSALSFTEHLKELAADGSYTTNNQPRELFFIKILSVFASVTNNSYWITSLYLSFLSFITFWFFVITIAKIFPSTKTVALIAFLFIPSIIFWSSGILKDTISSTALIFSTTILLKVIYLKRSSILTIILGLISLIILFNIKHYLFIVFILFSGLFLDLRLLSVVKKKIKWVIAFGIMIAIIGSTQFVHPYFTWNKIPQTILEINETIHENSSYSDPEMVTIDEPTWAAIALATPEALITGLFSPSIFDTTIPFGWIHRIENFILLILTILSILFWIKEKPKVDFTLLVPALVCICLLATMLALTTPNFGSLVRYKNAFMPFLFLIVSILPYQFIITKKTEIHV
jgi:hypothetical protein